MNLYKSMFLKTIEPTNGLEAQDILDFGQKLKDSDSSSDVEKAIGEVALRIGRLRRFADFILNGEFEGPRSPTVPFTKKDVMAYLDRNIKFWREMDRDQNVVAPDYIDAYQSVRMSLFGETLSEDDMQG